MIFSGEGWGEFKVFPGTHNDGRPAILCLDMTSGQSWIITVERWIRERAEGKIQRIS